MLFQFGDRLTVTLVANNLSKEHRTLTVALTLVRINSIDQSDSLFNEHNQPPYYNRHVAYNNKGSQTLIKSLAHICHVDSNCRER